MFVAVSNTKLAFYMLVKKTAKVFRACKNCKDKSAEKYFEVFIAVNIIENSVLKIYVKSKGLFILYSLLNVPY